MGRTKITIAVLCTVFSTIAVLSVSACCVGWAARPECRFLDPSRAPTPEEAAAIYPIEYALETRDANDVIFIGDSACRHGIDPLALGVPAYNLGTIGPIGLSCDLITLRAYLARHARPRIVALCLSPLGLDFPDNDRDDPNRNPIRGRFVANYSPLLDGLSLESFTFFVRAGIKSAAWGCNRRDVRDEEFWDGRLRGESYRTMQKTLRATHGHWKLPIEPHRKTEIRPGSLMDRDFDRRVREIARVCRDGGLPLVVIFMPICTDVRDTRDWSQLDGWAAKLERDTAATVARPIVVMYDSDFMWDSAHLNARGAARFMPTVARDVEAALGK